MAVRYDKATFDSKGPAPGMVALVAHWVRTTGLGSLGIYNFRPPRGGRGISVHGEGRAGDLKCNAHGPREKAIGDAYAAWLIEHSEELQIQYIIWNRRSWKSGRGWRSYSGVSPHTDHLHVEQNRDGAAQVHPLLTGSGPTLEDDMTKEESDMLTEVHRQLTSGDGTVRMAVLRGEPGKPGFATVYDDMVIRTGDAANNINALRAHIIAIGRKLGELDLDVTVDIDASAVAGELLEVLPSAVVDELKARL